MEKEKEEKKILHCIFGNTVRSVISQANELEIQKENIVKIFTFQDF